MPVAIQLEGLLREVLGAHDDPRAGGLVFDALAPEAPVYLNAPLLSQLVPTPGLPAQPAVLGAGSLSREDFARYYEASSKHVAECWPQRQLPAVTELKSVSAETDVAWFEATLSNGIPCAIGVGLQEGRIGWLTLTKAPQPWSFEQGLAQTIADYPFAVGARFPFPRTWLDVGYYRHFGHDRPPLLTMHDARFSCHGSTMCCRVGFRVELPPAAQAAVTALGFEDRLPVLASGQVLLKTDGEDCRFLNADRSCRIHAAAGRAVFDVCARYPFSFRPTPDGMVVSATPSCPSARKNMGPLLSERADDLYERLAMVAPAGLAAYRLVPGQEVSWEAFAEAEAALLDLLAEDDLPVAQRLWLGAIALAERTGEPYAEALPAPDDLAREVIEGLLGFFDGELGISGAQPAWGGHIPLVDEPEVLRLMKMVLHGKFHSFRYDLRTAFHVAVFVYALALRAQAHQPGEALPEAFLWRLSAQAMHSMTLAGLGDERPMGKMLAHALRAGNFGELAIPLLAP